MCVPACTQKIADSMARRKFLKGALGVSAAAATSACTPVVNSTGPLLVPQSQRTGVTFNDVVDLTHPLDINFPTYSGNQQLEIETLGTLTDNGVNIKRLLLVEHTGTHLDAPFHFSDQDTAEMIPIEQLIGPLVIIDIRAKAEVDPDAQVTPDDIAAWEATHGPLPPGAIVALLSGWDAHVNSEQYRNADADGVMHFPGFHVETADLLLEKHEIKGVMVDTLSLDFGPSPDFAFHFRWLEANRWGMECVANLSQLPASGATVIAGGPKIVGATGGPSRVIALL